MPELLLLGTLIFALGCLSGTVATARYMTTHLEQTEEGPPTPCGPPLSPRLPDPGARSPLRLVS